jgi:cold shock CspA family protein
MREMLLNDSVKFYNWNKGYGFLLCPALGEDVFVGANAVALPPGEYLLTGQQVEFTLGSDSDGRPRAENVRLVGQEQDDATAEDARPYVQYPGQRRQYLTSDMTR